MNRSSTTNTKGERKRSFLLGRRSKSNQRANTSTTRSRPFGRGSRRPTTSTESETHIPETHSVTDIRPTTPSTHKSQAIQKQTEESSTFFDRLLQVDDQKKELLEERRRVVEEQENTCICLNEILRYHEQQIQHARSKLAQRKQKQVVAQANRNKAVMTDSDDEEEEEAEVMEELESTIKEMQDRLDSLTHKYEDKQEALARSKRRLAECEREALEGDGDLSVLTSDDSTASPIRAAGTPRNNPFDDEEANHRTSPSNPFDDDEDATSPHHQKTTSPSKQHVGHFILLSEALSKQMIGITSKQEWLDWLERERLEKQVAQLSTQKEQTERAIDCLQQQMEEDRYNHHHHNRKPNSPPRNPTQPWFIGNAGGSMAL
eukprot:CAMPEP_0172445616 /NCGR_PEP_ID=MMETSP1065-20121228/5430_1 /TAXON_ID=265537 /ORGANISM="Amphiprora paludosa, Strain CCMP125" /LENGTH=374 /DNA_ID=CAMNT_0013196521 /DNA_START=41 /DNA_END=1165 /DNA_ORIENTATION=-